MGTRQRSGHGEEILELHGPLRIHGPGRLQQRFLSERPHEIQILGDSKSGKTSTGGNGAIYSFKAPDVFASKPGNEWQTLETTIIGDKITVILNGEKIHDNVVCTKPTGSEIDRNVTEPGPIFLQGDHGTVAFRNLQIKELPQN